MKIEKSVVSGLHAEDAAGAGGQQDRRGQPQRQAHQARGETDRSLVATRPRDTILICDWLSRAGRGAATTRPETGTSCRLSSSGNC